MMELPDGSAIFRCLQNWNPKSIMSEFAANTCMPAIVCHAPLDYRLEELPVPQPQDHEIILEVGSVGICASDLKCYLGAPMFWGTDETDGYCQAPIIPGHEFAGTVAAIGEAARERNRLQVGDKVVSEQIVPCQRCRYCRRGQYWMCMKHDIYGFRKATPGAMAQYVRLPANALNYRVPDALPLSWAAYIEPLACGIHAVQRADIELQHTVVIAGAGPLGLGMVAAARLKNPALLIALDLNEERLAVARACGADVTLNPAQVDVVDKVLGLTEGYGCDVYIEATGHPGAVQQGLDMICKLGTFVEFSVMREPVTVDWTIIGDTKELNIHGAHLSPHAYPVAIRMLEQGLLPMDRIVTHELPLAEFQQGIELVASGDKSIKVTLQP